MARPMPVAHTIEDDGSEQNLANVSRHVVFCSNEFSWYNQKGFIGSFAATANSNGIAPDLSRPVSFTPYFPHRK